LQSDLRPLSPPLWAKKGHLQTLAGFLIPSSSPQDLGEKVILPLADSEDKLLAFFDDHGSREIYVFFHGLGGSVKSNYMLRSRSLMSTRGKTSVLVNHRQAGEGRGLAKGIYHSGKTEDISQVIQFIRKKMGPDKIIIAVGFSLSANILLLLNGRDRHLNQADGYISINGPIQLLHCAKALRSGVNKIYDQYFVRLLKPMISQDIRNSFEIKTLWDIDQVWTSQLAGFSSREQYYKECSSAPFLSCLQEPHVILTAKDDPFILFEDYAKSYYSKSAFTFFSEAGGHLGYFSNSNTQLGNRRWLDYFLWKTSETLERVL
jgi:predicted alpha/beta-fold hydrolase